MAAGKIDLEELPSQATLENNLRWAERKLDELAKVIDAVEQWRDQANRFGFDPEKEIELLERLYRDYETSEHEYHAARQSFEGFPEAFSFATQTINIDYFELARKLIEERAKHGFKQREN